MSFRDLLADTFHTLAAHKRRTALTMFGITWGIISITLMVAAGEGLGDLFLTRDGRRHGVEVKFSEAPAPTRSMRVAVGPKARRETPEAQVGADLASARWTRGAHAEYSLCRRG
jgi:hypothetical protein